MTNLRTQESRYHIRATFVFKLYRSSLPANEDYTWIFIIRKMSMHSVIVRDQQEEQNEEDQINHRDTRILTWKTLQSERKNHGHQSVITFTIFIKCLQEHCDLFRRLTRGLYSKTLIRTVGAPPPHPVRPQSGPKASWSHFARQLYHL
jgi:hypothetical protein